MYGVRVKGIEGGQEERGGEGASETVEEKSWSIPPPRLSVAACQACMASVIVSSPSDASISKPPALLRYTSQE